MTINQKKDKKKLFSFAIVSEANKHSTPRRGVICANFETLGSKFSREEIDEVKPSTAPPPRRE